MKKILFSLAAIAVSLNLFAQKEEQTKSDTIKVGNFVIIKKRSAKKETGSSSDDGVTIIGGEEKKSVKRKRKNISTNYFIVDLGFAGLRDETNYTTAQSSSYLKALPNTGSINANSMRLNKGKTSNVNLWFVMKKLNISNHVFNLKYGLGLEMYNFRYDGSLSYRKSGSTSFIYNDSVNFSKNKLFASYLTVPLMLNVNTTPNKKSGFSFSAGVSAGYLLKNRNKQISNERGKVKYNGDFNLDPFRLAAIGEIGLGKVRIYGSYSFNALHESSTMLNQYPYTVGFRFSNW